MNKNVNTLQSTRWSCNSNRSPLLTRDSFRESSSCGFPRSLTSRWEEVSHEVVISKSERSRSIIWVLTWRFLEIFHKSGGWQYDVLKKCNCYHLFDKLNGNNQKWWTVQTRDMTILNDCFSFNLTVWLDRQWWGIDCQKEQSKTNNKYPPPPLPHSNITAPVRPSFQVNHILTFFGFSIGCISWINRRNWAINRLESFSHTIL